MGSEASAMFDHKMRIAGVLPSDRTAIAVSGGPDSIALSLLAFQWKQRNHASGGLIGLTVDHGFRAESASETVQVKKWLQEIGMECEILKCCWPDGIPPHGHLQESARRARYELLQDACKKYNAGILLTAHHADDQAELFVLRLSRSSGASGLAGMALVTELFPYKPSQEPHKLLLVRPLMSFSKNDLYEICRNIGQDWIEDPSNTKMIFARNRIRKSLSVSSSTMSCEIQALISTYRKARSDLETKRNLLLKQFASVNPDFGYVRLDVEGLFSATSDEDVLAKVLVAVLQFVAQKGSPPRSRVIQSIMNWLHDTPIRGARTGGRCCLFPQTGSKGAKVIVTFQPDVVRPPNSEKHLDSPQRPSDTKVVNRSSEKHLMEAKALGVISDSTACFLTELSNETAKDMLAKNADEQDSETTFQQVEAVTFEAERSLYFMERFMIMWWREQACCLKASEHNAALAKLRFFQDKDLLELKRLWSTEQSCCGAEAENKMADAVKLLKSLPKHVQRGLIVLTTPKNELISVPSVGLQACLNSRVTIKFCPRVPLGGGQCSWL